jgi:hypothetical protein
MIQTPVFFVLFGSIIGIINFPGFIVDEPFYFYDNRFWDSEALQNAGQS